jgi:hypothetical protein
MSCPNFQGNVLMSNSQAAARGAAHKALHTSEGSSRYHYKLLVYTTYRNYDLPYLRWSLENKMKSLVYKTVSMSDPFVRGSNRP